MKKIIVKIIIFTAICASIFGIITHNEQVKAKDENDLLNDASSDYFYRNNYTPGTEIEWGNYVIKRPQAACLGHYSAGAGYGGYYAIQTIIDINVEGGYGTGYVKINDYTRGVHTIAGDVYGVKMAACMAYATAYDRTHEPFGGTGYRDGSFALKNNLISAVNNNWFWRGSIYPGYVYSSGKQNDLPYAWSERVSHWAWDIPDSIPGEDPRITFLTTSKESSAQKDKDRGTWIGPYKIENIGQNTIYTAVAKIDGIERHAVAWGILNSNGTYSVNTNISAIPNRTEFWLKFNENFEIDQVGSVAIRGKTKNIYQARMIILGYPVGGDQTVGIFRGRRVSVDVGTDIYADFALVPTKTTTYIAKEGANETLSGTQFKVYDQNRKQYLKDATGSKTVWVDEFKDATIYQTDASGVVNLGKFDTNKEGPLTIIELGVGNNGNYSDPLILESASMGTVETKVIDGKTYPVVTGVKITGSTLKISVKDTKTSTDLKITKKDNKTGKTIKGVEFKVLLEKAKYIDGLSNMWVTQGGTGTVNFTNDKHDKYLSPDPNNAGKFITGDDGYVFIKGIVAGTYHIYETKSVPYYDMEVQKGYNKEKQWIDCGTIELPGNSSGVNITVENIPTRGDLEIQKKDPKKDDVKQAGAKFKIQLIESKVIPRMNGKWLTTTSVGNKEKFDYTNVQNGKYDYTNYENDSYFTDNVQDAGIFTTGPDSKINITCLLNGKYHIYEIDAAEGYKIEEQDEYGKDSRYPTWVDCGEFTVESWEDNKCIVNNDKIVVKIEGNVWLDIPNISIKDIPEYNGLIDDAPDKKLGRNNSLSKR